MSTGGASSRTAGSENDRAEPQPNSPQRTASAFAIVIVPHRNPLRSLDRYRRCNRTSHQRVRNRNRAAIAPNHTATHHPKIAVAVATAIALRRTVPAIVATAPHSARNRTYVLLIGCSVTFDATAMFFFALKKKIYIANTSL